MTSVADVGLGYLALDHLGLPGAAIRWLDARWRPSEVCSIRMQTWIVTT